MSPLWEPGLTCRKVWLARSQLSRWPLHGGHSWLEELGVYPMFRQGRLHQPQGLPAEFGQAVSP